MDKASAKFKDLLFNLNPGERLIIEKTDHEIFFKFERAGHYTSAMFPIEYVTNDTLFEETVRQCTYLTEGLDILEGLKSTNE